MASGRTSPHKIRLATTHEVLPDIELQLYHPAQVGITVRVTVFDEQLFRSGALAEHYNAVFSTFIGSLDPVVPSVVRDPASLVGDGLNGVLLTFERPVVGEVPQGGKAVHRKWAFGAAQNVTTCAPANVFLDIALGMRDEHNELAYGPVIRLPRAPAYRMRRIVIVVSNPATNQILYSNTWRQGALAASNLQGGPTLVDSKAVEAGISARVGGSGEGTGAPAPAGRPLPNPDVTVTGMYEAFDRADASLGENFPNLMVALNVAGGAVAGWWAPPPEVVTGHAHHRMTQPPLSRPLERGRFGVLLGHFETDGYHILWGRSSVSRDPTPELVGALHPAPDSTTGIGSITAEEGDSLRLTLRRGDAATVLYLRRTEPTPRWSNATLDQVLARAAESSPFVRRSARYQERPIPLAFWTLLQHDLFETGALGRLIVAHESLPKNDTIARRGPRTEISNYLEILTQQAEYADAVVAHFALFASNVDITIGDVTKSTYDWLHQIAADFLSNLVEQDIDAGVAIDRLPNGFKAVGIVPENLFVYRAEFFSLGAKVSLGVKVGAYGFEAHFRRNHLVRGIEREPPRDDPWHGVTKPMYGGFGDIGISLGPGLKTGASTMLSNVAFRSFHRIDPIRFNRANFYVVSASALSVSGALLSARAARSAVMVMTVETTEGAAAGSSVRMVAGVDSFMMPPATTRQLIKKKPVGFNISLFSMTLGWGWMIEREASSIGPPTETTAPEETLGRAERSFGAYFRKNSATLEGRNLSAFEEALAVERAIFVSGGGHARAAGHASPEGPNNAALSQRRADNVIQVVRDTFGSQLAVSALGIGYGDRAARNAGLTTDAGGYRRNEPAVWVQYRVVMLWVSGVLLIELRLGKVLPTGEG